MDSRLETWRMAHRLSGADELAVLIKSRIARSPSFPDDKRIDYCREDYASKIGCEVMHSIVRRPDAMAAEELLVNQLQYFVVG